MQSKRIDINLTVLGALLVLISSYFLFIHNPLQVNEGPVLAKLISRDQLVRTKKAASMQWSDAFEGSDLMGRQMIYTFKNSRAQIQFKNGNAISVEENSLIKIPPEEKIDFMLDKGFIKATLKGDKPLLFELKGESYSLSGKEAEVQIAMKGDKATVGVLKGVVEVAKGKQIVQLDTKKTLEINQEKPEELQVKEIPFTILNPQPFQQFYSAQPEKEIAFAWENQHQASKIEIARDQNFEDLIISKENLDHQFKASLKLGTYYWRLLSQSGPSLASSFKIEWESAPVILSPRDGEEIQFKGDEKEKHLNLHWKKSTSTYAVETEWDGKTQEHISTSDQLKFPVEHSGNLKWRVKINDDLRPEAVFSEWQNIKVKFFSLEGVQVIQINRPDQKIKIEWNNDEKSEVEFRLARDPKFEDVVISKQGKLSEAEFFVKEQGVYYWQSKNLQGKTMELKKIKVEPIPPPAKPEKLPDMEIPIEWKEKETTSLFKIMIDFILPSAHADEAKVMLNVPAKADIEFYHIEIYRDEKLEIKVFETQSKETKIVWEDARPGTFFWRYSLVDFFGRQSPFSEISKLTLSPKPILERAKLKFPIRKEEVDEGKIKFAWTEAAPEANYTFDIGEDEAFEKLLFQQKLKEKEIEVEAKLPPGKILFWRVKSQLGLDVVQSNVGRFQVKAREIEVEPIQRYLLKERKMELTWLPSSDSYKFENENMKGSISGTALASYRVQAYLPGEKFTSEINFLRHSGKVFDGQKYLNQQMQYKLWYRWNENILLGASAAAVSTQSYARDGDKVKAEGVSGTNFGPSLGYAFDHTSKWDRLVLFDYALGVVPEMKLEMRNYLPFKTSQHFQFGLSYVNRHYKKDEFKGTQTSLQLEMGWGLSF